ncbi:uncharacterized protein LOC116178281 [Photinus pyralis]|uniref:uncharacterized protein LOC116178281 n=1 Tax=Photinus pyralis TaxID=7054 RepID=UPI0012670B58|nr:uncharacterized protein LOC116178281 [Photinus pyralis]
MLSKFTLLFCSVLNPNGPVHRAYSSSCIMQVIENQFVESNTLLTILTTRNLSTKAYGIQDRIIREINSRVRWMIEIISGARLEFNSTEVCANCPLKKGALPIITRQFQLLYKATYCVVVVDTHKQFETVFRYFLDSNSHNYHTYFLVYVSDIRFEYAKMAESILKFLWRHNVFNSAVVVPRDSLRVCTIYGLNVYAPALVCGKNPQLVELDTCINGEVANNNTLFGNKLPKTYGNCSVPTIAMKYPPFVVDESRGFEINILKEIGKILDIRFNIKMINTAVDWGIRLGHNNWSGPLATVYKESAIAVGNILPHPNYDADFDLSIEYFRERMAWVVPTAHPIPRWQNIFVIFTYELWLVCACFYIVASVLLYATSRFVEEVLCYQHLSTNFLFCLEIILAVAVPKQPKSYVTRSVFISIAIYGILITVMYQALLMSHLLNPVYEKELSSLQDIIDSKIGIGGVRRYKEFFNRSDDKVSTYIHDRFETYNETNDTALNWLLTVANDRDTCTISSHFYVKYMIGDKGSVFFNKWGDEKIVMLKQLVFTYPVRMIVPRGFPLGITFDKVIWKLMNGGIVRKWAKKYEQRSRHDSEETDDTVLTVFHLQGAFLLLSYGYLFAVCAFLSELVVYYKIAKFGEHHN